jgi:hypothetical protein
MKILDRLTSQVQLSQASYEMSCVFYHIKRRQV